MKVEYNDVLSVLALFDTSDIPYIKSVNYLKFMDDNLENNNKLIPKVKVKEKKKVGDNNE